MRQLVMIPCFSALSAAAIRSMVCLGASALALLLGTLTLASCGGGGGSKSASPANGAVSGAAVKGLVAGATVRAFTIQSDGTAGTELGSTTTLSDGTYTLSIGNHSGPFLLEVSGGSYADEATGASTPLTEPLRGVLPSFVSGAAVSNVALTPLTAIAARQALDNVALGTNAATAIADANTQIAAYFGLANIITALPNDLAAGSATPGSAAAAYGAVLAGISRQAADLGVAADALAAALAQDAADGAFDGNAGATPITIGAVALPADAAQTGLAAAITDFLNSAQNASGLDASDAANLTTHINANPQTTVVLVSITVTPASAMIEVGQTQAFTATGTFSDGTTDDLTLSAAWSSSDEQLAVIEQSGVATGGAVGDVTITAANATGLVTGTATLMVKPVLVSIEVTPDAPMIDAGQTQAFIATGTFSDNSTQDITAVATWASDATNVATVGAATGVAAGVSPGTAEITASFTTAAGATISDSTLLTVTAVTLLSIDVTPDSAALNIGATVQLTATGNFSSGNPQNLTGSATWSTDDDTVATVSAGGLVTAVGMGTTMIRAEENGIDGAMTVTVTAAPTLQSIALTPSTPSITAGATQQFTATGTFSDSSTQDLTTSVTWESSETGIATINSSGLATSLAAGTTVITASEGAVTSAGVTLTVNAPAVSYSNDLVPLISQFGCAQSGCHSGSSPPNNFNITTYSGLLSRVTPNDADNSLLIKRLSGTTAGAQMPPVGSGSSFMSSAQIQKFRDWINQGAPNN